MSSNFRAFHEMPRYFSHFMKCSTEFTFHEMTKIITVHSLPVTYIHLVLGHNQDNLAVTAIQYNRFFPWLNIKYLQTYTF